jgi:hypothetical protein
MVQLWLMRSDVNPAESVETGAMASGCLDCPRQPSKHAAAVEAGLATTDGPCYVDVTRGGPAATWRAVDTGATPLVTFGELVEAVAGEPIRLMAWGDPGALTWEQVAALISASQGWTGYTHAWRSRPDLRPILRASCDTLAEAQEALAAGWRVFFVSPVGEPKAPGAVWCAKSGQQAGARELTCIECGACTGAAGARLIQIPDHGPGARAAGKRRLAMVA